MLERDYQSRLIRRIENMWPACVIMKQDTSFYQGVPDLIILHKNGWAMLEVKESEKASRRPNQEYYVDFYNGMSFAAFISPENEEDVLHDLQQALQLGRPARVSKRQ